VFKILEKNWLDVYSPWARWSTGQGELPKVKDGSRVTPSVLLMTLDMRFGVVGGIVCAVESDCATSN